MARDAVRGAKAGSNSPRLKTSWLASAGFQPRHEKQQGRLPKFFFAKPGVIIWRPTIGPVKQTKSSSLPRHPRLVTNRNRTR